MTVMHLFSARLEAHFEQIDDIYRLARYCHLESFVEQIEDRVKKVVTFGKFSIITGTRMS